MLAVSLFVVVATLLLLGSLMLAASPLAFIVYIAILVATVGSAYLYGRGRWY